MYCKNITNVLRRGPTKSGTLAANPAVPTRILSAFASVSILDVCLGTVLLGMQLELVAVMLLEVAGAKLSIGQSLDVRRVVESAQT